MCWNKQPGINYKLANGSMDYSMKSSTTLEWCVFMCVYKRHKHLYKPKYTRASKRKIFSVAQTYHGPGDSTQTLWTRLSCKSLGSNRSCFTRRALGARLTLHVDTKSNGYDWRRNLRKMLSPVKCVPRDQLNDLKFSFNIVQIHFNYLQPNWIKYLIYPKTCWNTCQVFLLQL